MSKERNIYCTKFPICIGQEISYNKVMFNRNIPCNGTIIKIIHDERRVLVSSYSHTGRRSVSYDNILNFDGDGHEKYRRNSR